MTADAPGKPGEPVCRRLLPPVQAADVVRESHSLPVEWFWHLVNTGEIPVYRLSGGRRIDEFELARVVAAHQAKRR